MKSYKNIFKSLFCLALGVGMTACSSDSYDPAPQVSGMQVFFSAESPSTYELKSTESTFDIEVSRVVTAEAAEIPVEVTTVKGGEGYTFPTSVKFEEGDSVANMTVSYDADKIGFENPSEFTVSLADDKYATPYGVRSHSFKVVIPAPWSPWCATKAQWEKAGLDGNDFPFPNCTGTCTYTYTQFFGGDDSGLPFYYRQNLLDPTIGEIRIDSWCYGVTLILNFNPQTNNIQIEPQFSGCIDDELGDVYITDVSHWQNKDYYASYPCKFDPVTGRIVLNTAWMAGANHASCYGYGEEYIQLAGYYVPDYSVETSYCGVLTDASGNVSAQLSVSITGQDVAKVVGVVMEGDADADAVAEAIKAGELEAAELENGYNNLAIGDKTGSLQAVVVVFDAEDNIQAVKSSNFEYYGGGKSPWKSLGKGYFTDDAVLTMFFNAEAPAYEVEIQEHTEKPGYYRLVDPYTEGVYPYTSESLEKPLAPAGKYLYVDATDPEAVYVEEQEVGMDWGYGAMTLQSVGYDYLAYYGPDMFETIKSKGFFGSVNEGVISFPLFEAETQSGETYSYQWYLGMGGKYYNTGEKISIVLPGAPAAVKAACKTRAKGTMRLARANGKIKKQAGKSLRFPVFLELSLKN